MPTSCRRRSTSDSSELETALEALDVRPVVYDAAEIARAGVFVSIDSDGDLRMERGYVRPEDEPPIELVEDGDGGSPAANEPKETTQHAVITIGRHRGSPTAPRQRRSRSAISNGQSNCRRTRVSFGRC